MLYVISNKEMDKIIDHNKPQHCPWIFFNKIIPDYWRLY